MPETSSPGSKRHEPSDAGCAAGTDGRGLADPSPATAAAAIASLENSQARLWRSLSALQDSELTKERATDWGDRMPAWRIFWTMIFHDAHHGAEIACLRDLYRATQG